MLVLCAAFGVVLWELLTWQEPWEEEGLGSFQIMIAVQQQQQRPAIPALDRLPGQLGPNEAVQGYLQLIADCWAQSYSQRPNFEVIVTRLKALLKMGGPNAAAGPSAAAAAPSPFHRNASEPTLMPAGSPAGPAAADGAGHKHSKSEVVGREAVIAAAQGPDIADLLHLGDDDGLPGPSAPAPPAAALPPIPATTPEGYGSTDADASTGSSSSGGSSSAAAGPRQVIRQITLSRGVADGPVSSSSNGPAVDPQPAAAALPSANGVAGVNGNANSTPTAAAAAKPPRPPRSPAAPAGSPFAGAGATAGSPFSPFAAAQQYQQQDGSTPNTPTKQQNIGVQIPVSYGATAAAAGPERPGGHASPFAAAAAQSTELRSPTAAAAPAKALTIPVAVPAALGQALEQGGSPFSRSPIKLSPFAAAVAAAISAPVLTYSSSPRVSGEHSGNDSGSFGTAGFSGLASSGNPSAVCPLEAAVEAGSAVDAGTRAARHSSSSSNTAAGAGSSSSNHGSARQSTSNAVEAVLASDQPKSPTAAAAAPVVMFGSAEPVATSGSSNRSGNVSGVGSLAGGITAVHAPSAAPR